jgi:hypothetical protein
MSILSQICNFEVEGYNIISNIAPSQTEITEMFLSQAGNEQNVEGCKGGGKHKGAND